MKITLEHLSVRYAYLTLLLAAVLGLSPLSAPAQSGSWLLRGSGAYIAPISDSDAILGNDGAEVQSAASFAFTVSYGVTEHVAATVLGSAPFNHDIDGTGALDDVRLGDGLHLPPTFILEYRLLPDRSVRPYVGVGVNYTWFLDDDASGELTRTLDTVLEGSVQRTDLDLSNSVGVAAVAGVDWFVADAWGVNASLWFADIDTEADVLVNGTPAVEDVDVSIDPLIPQLGLFYQF